LWASFALQESNPANEDGASARALQFFRGFSGRPPGKMILLQASAKYYVRWADHVIE
jgi:hypothetical protein